MGVGMYGHRYQKVALSLLCAALLGGCSSLQPAPRHDAQHDAVNRWTRCIERYSDQYRGPVLLAGKRADHHCEGHRRDVIAMYPHHLKNQIESLLSERAYTITSVRVVKTSSSRNHLEAFEGSHLDTLKNRLRGAHRADL